MTEPVWVLLDCAAPEQAWSRDEYHPAWAEGYSNPGRALLALEYINIGSDDFAQITWRRGPHPYFLEGQDDEGARYILYREGVDGEYLDLMKHHPAFASTR